MGLPKAGRGSQSRQTYSSALEVASICVDPRIGGADRSGGSSRPADWEQAMVVSSSLTVATEGVCVKSMVLGVPFSRGGPVRKMLEATWQHGKHETPMPWDWQTAFGDGGSLHCPTLEQMHAAGQMRGMLSSPACVPCATEMADD